MFALPEKDACNLFRANNPRGISSVEFLELAWQLGTWGLGGLSARRYCCKIHFPMSALPREGIKLPPHLLFMFVKILS